MFLFAIKYLFSLSFPNPNLFCHAHTEAARVRVCHLVIRQRPSITLLAYSAVMQS